MMDSVEKITTLIPKFKQQLIFLKEREKLFKSNDGYSIHSTDSSSILSTNAYLSSSPSTNSNSSSSSHISILHHSSEESINNSSSDQSLVARDMNICFPDEYTIPSLPRNLMKDIEEGNLSKLGPHFANRQILIDTITHDLINKYNLL